MKSPVVDVCVFYVTTILRRPMTPADWRGRHMKAASIIVKQMGYKAEVVKEALSALAARDYAAFGYDYDCLPANVSIEMLWSWGEPPLIERFLTPPPRPEVWSHDYDKWVRRWGRTAIERGQWDGIYRRSDPTALPWLEEAIGEEYYAKSIVAYFQENNRREGDGQAAG